MAFFLYWAKNFQRLLKNVTVGTGGYILGSVQGQPPKCYILMLHRTVFILHCVVVIARKRSCGKVMFLQLSVCQSFCSRGGGRAWQQGPCVVGACVAGETATETGGTHPTGMHSCFCSSSQGSHSDWKTSKMERHFQVREF